MNTFDASAWIGRWPFSFCDAHTAKSLQAHLRQHGIGAALVSPLDAVFAPEPGPANRDLLRQTRGLKGLVPVPVINPALDVLASGMLRPDILKLAPRYSRLLCDLSFAEWFDTMENLTAKVSVRQLAFASHTPLLITAAARAKLDTSTLTAAQKRAVASGNLERWWGR